MYSSVCVCERETKLNHIEGDQGSRGRGVCGGEGQTKQTVAVITELCDALAATQSEIIYGRLAWVARKS